MSEHLEAIRIPVFLWARLVPELRRRGAGHRESGAFLLGGRNGVTARVTQFLCYDDLDPNALDSGAVTFHAAGYSALWKRCREHGVELIADVHTHPGSDVRQSFIDQHHPMVPIPGHTAMIVPNLGRTSRWSLASVSVYEYLGNFKWRVHASGAKRRRVELCLW